MDNGLYSEGQNEHLHCFATEGRAPVFLPVFVLLAQYLKNHQIHLNETVRKHSLDVSLLIIQGIFQHSFIYLLQLTCSASLSYFQVDIFRGRREGRRAVVYTAGVTLDFVTGLGDVPRRASFCCCGKSLVTFPGSSPLRLNELELVGFHQPPATIYWDPV